MTGVTTRTNMMKISSTKNSESEMTAAFLGDEMVKPAATVEIWRFAAALTRVNSSIIRGHLNLAAAVLLGLGTILCDSPTRADPATAEITAAQANAALIKSAYDAFSRGDTQSVFAVFAQNILRHVPGRGPLSRDYRGHAEVAGFFEHFMGLSEGTFRIQIDEIIANRDRVIVLCTERASRAGRTWSSPQVHVWTVKDGRATVFWEYEGDQQGEDEFWSAHP
jgi:ketosteroid isomerase-like protein